MTERGPEPEPEPATEATTPARKEVQSSPSASPVSTPEKEAVSGYPLVSAVREIVTIEPSLGVKKIIAAVKETYGGVLGVFGAKEVRTGERQAGGRVSLSIFCTRLFIVLRKMTRGQGQGW